MSTTYSEGANNLMIAPYSTTFEDILSMPLEIQNGGTGKDVSDIVVCLASTMSNNEETLEFRRLELSQDLEGKFREKVQKFLASYSKTWQSGGRVIYPYQGDSKPEDHEIEYVDMAAANYAFIKAQVQPIRSYQDKLSFQQSDTAFIQGLRFYVIVAKPLHNSQDIVYLYRFYSQKQLLGQSRFFGAIWRGNNEYDLVSEPTLLFDNNIDCVSRGDELFIFKKDNFHSIFRFLEELEKSVTVAVTSIHTQLTQIRVAVDGYDDFVNDCKKNRLKMAMLNNIAKKPYLKDLTPAKIQRVVDRLDKNLVGEAFLTAFTKEQKLLYDAKRPWVLLKLLGDSYLWSDMTEIGYDVNAKREL